MRCENIPEKGSLRGLQPRIDVSRSLREIGFTERTRRIARFLGPAQISGPHRFNGGDAVESGDPGLTRGERVESPHLIAAACRQGERAAWKDMQSAMQLDSSTVRAAGSILGSTPSVCIAGASSRVSSPGRALRTLMRTE